LDFIAKRYGVLPSQCLAEGSNIDVVCAEIAIGYEGYLNEKSRAQAEGKPLPVTNKYSTEELQSMIDSVKRDKKIDG